MMSGDNVAELRWILLILGLSILAGIYFYSRGWFGWGAAFASTLQRRREPAISDAEDRVPPPEAPQLQAQPTRQYEPKADLSQATLSPDEQSRVITIRVLPQTGQLLSGKQLALALRAAGLQYGKFDIFHRVDPQKPAHALFSVASLVEPGSFDLNQLEKSEFPGINFFMVLPGPDHILAAFDEMLSAASSLAESLEANLFDERGSTLSVQRARYMREEMVQFQHQNSRANALCG